MSFDAPDRSKAAAEYSPANFTWQLDMFENRLGDRQFVMDAFSLADIPIAATLGLDIMVGVSLGQQPRFVDGSIRGSDLYIGGKWHAVDHHVWAKLG